MLHGQQVCLSIQTAGSVRQVGGSLPSLCRVLHETLHSRNRYTPGQDNFFLLVGAQQSMARQLVCCLQTYVLQGTRMTTAEPSILLQEFCCTASQDQVQLTSGQHFISRMVQDVLDLE